MVFIFEDRFHKWCDLGDPEIEIRELNEVISWLSGKADPCCTSLGTCSHWYVVDYNGDVFPCEVLGRESRYGNILVDDFQSISQAPAHQQLVEIQRSKPAKCMSCEFLKVCNNGCTQMRLTDGVQNFRGLYAYCDQRLALFQEVKKTFESATI